MKGKRQAQNSQPHFRVAYSTGPLTPTTRHLVRETVSKSQSPPKVYRMSKKALTLEQIQQSPPPTNTTLLMTSGTNQDLYEIPMEQTIESLELEIRGIKSEMRMEKENQKAEIVRISEQIEKDIKSKWF